VHAHQPLQGDDRTLDRLQQAQGQTEHHGPPDEGMRPVARRIGHLDVKRQRHDDVSDQHDRQVGREIVGAMMVERLAAMRAVLDHLGKGAEQPTLAARRAAAAKAAQQREACRLGPGHWGDSFFVFRTAGVSPAHEL